MSYAAERACKITSYAFSALTHYGIYDDPAGCDVR